MWPAPRWLAGPDVSNAFISHMRTSLWRSVFRRIDDREAEAGVSDLRGWFHEGMPDAHCCFWDFRCASHSYYGSHCVVSLRLRQELTKGLSLPAEHFINRLMSMEWRCGLSSPASWYRTDLFRVLTDAFAMNAWMSIGSSTSVMQENHQWMALGF